LTLRAKPVRKSRKAAKLVKPWMTPEQVLKAEVGQFHAEPLDFLADYEARLTAWLQANRLDNAGKEALVNSMQVTASGFLELANQCRFGDA
jgi:hypothetical protein